MCLAVNLLPSGYCLQGHISSMMNKKKWQLLLANGIKLLLLALLMDIFTIFLYVFIVQLFSGDFIFFFRTLQNFSILPLLFTLLMQYGIVKLLYRKQWIHQQQSMRSVSVMIFFMNILALAFLYAMNNFL